VGAGDALGVERDGEAVFSPRIRQPPGTLRASVRRRETSEPHEGSVTAIAATASPAIS
jgi:hypothetical protein